MCKLRRGETFRMRAQLPRYSKSIRLVSHGVKGEMKDDECSPEEPRCLFISVRGSGSTLRRAPSRFVYGALGLVVASNRKTRFLMWRCNSVAVS